uniref:Synaptobrevin, longin-like domain protein n=1 Tax=Tanacetum cinerariifolium TaxID=118510 RepID=A0A699IS93_TANCI|nr:hypothetical protein [Tanacetum cinerariifolium]
MVAYLSKSDASEGFNQLIDFLNRSSLKLQALVDKKKVVVTKAIIREALNLDDAKGVDCLPNEEIFAELARMGYEKQSTKLTFDKAFFSSQWKFLIHIILQCMSATRTSWNEFSSSMASAVICLSSGRKFIFSKYIFDSLVRNVDSPTNIYMYPRFLQLIIRKKVGDLSTHTTKYTSPALTQKEIDEQGDADEHVEEVNTGDVAHGDVSAARGEVPIVTEEPYIPSPTPPTPPPQSPQDIPSTSQRVKKLEKRNKVRVLKLRRLQRVRTSQRVATSNDIVMDDESNQGRMIAKIDQDDAVVLKDDKERIRRRMKLSQEVQEVVDVVTTAKLITEVVTVASETVTATSTIVTAAEAQVFAAILTAAPARITAAPSRRRKGVVIRDRKEAKDDETEPAEVQEVVDVITTTKLITKVVTATSAIVTTAEAQVPAATLTTAPARIVTAPNEPKPLKKKQQIELDKQYARELHAELNKDIDWDEAIDHAKFNSNVAFLLKIKERIKEDENRALQKLNETLAERAGKRRKLDDEVEKLRRHLQIVPNKDDDVYTEAIPLARKVPVVDYQIIEMNNKHYYKIIRADDTHQLYISFLSFLREDLEALWRLVKEKFSTTKPKNFSEDFLLVSFRAMFEKPDIHAQIWKTRRNEHGPAKVKGWKLLESCSVQIITFTSTQLILLVERKYLLTRFTLDQMLNAIRLEVKEESEVSLELLRFIRQQHQEGQLE